MSSPTEVVPFEDWHVAALFRDLRPADDMELRAFSGPDYEGPVVRGVMASPLKWTMLVGGELTAILGANAVPDYPGVGMPWCIGTTLLDRYGGRLVRIGPTYIREMLGKFDLLVNFVDVRSLRSVRWLRSLGFTLDPPQQVGEYGAVAHRFWMEAR